MYTIVALLSLSVLISLAMFPLARRSGTPLLLVVLAIGMLAGEDGLGGYLFNDFQLAFDLGSIALAVILFAGGLETDRGVFKNAGLPALVLAFLGVFVTAAIVGASMHFLLGMPILFALLLGAVVAPTDAAATFMLIQQGGLSIPERVKNTLLLESGFNDPAAISLTLIITAILGLSAQSGTPDWGQYLLLFLMQTGLGTLGGLVGGKLLSKFMNMLPMPVGTYPIMAITGGLLIFSATGLIGGSGFLAVYVAGLTLRNWLTMPLERIVNFSEGMQWVSQILLFLLLGLLVTPSSLPEAILPALVCTAVLTLLARPVAVFLSAGAFKFNFRELTFLSWVGLRGAVPILLAIYPIVTPGPVTPDFFNIVFVTVVASLTVQGFTANKVAKSLKLEASKPL